MSSFLAKFKLQSSMKSTKGRPISVYDGRSWPVVKCGPVYVTEDEKPKHVTKSVVAQSTAPEDKKKKSSKYTVAVGSSFGHVHTFLKDSDRVLSEFDKTEAEDKCLLLIRKPKSASKQMFKAHSLATLNVQDAHLKLLDGSTKPDPHKFFTYKGKRKPELSLPGQYGTLNKQRSYSQGSPTSDLTCLDENVIDSNNENVPNRQSKGQDTKYSYLYPYDEMFHHKSSDHMKSRRNTCSDILENNKEINNNSNKMGGGLTKPRPQRAPPAVPTRTNNSASNIRNEVTDSVPNGSRVLDYSNNNRPDLLSNVDSKLKSVQSFNDNINSLSDYSLKNGKPQQKHYGHKSENWDSETRRKHDSGFHSDVTIPNDQLYYAGFKSELVSRDSYLNEKNVAVSSSPVNRGFGMVRVDKEMSKEQTGHLVSKQHNNVNAEQPFNYEQLNAKSLENNTVVNTQTANNSRHSECLNTGNKCIRNPHANQRLSYPTSSGMHHSVSDKVEKKLSPNQQCMHVSNNRNTNHLQNTVPVHSSAPHQNHYDSYIVSARDQTAKTHQNNMHTEKHSTKVNTETCLHKNKNVDRNSSSGSGSTCSKRHSFSPKQRAINGYAQGYKQHSPKGYSQQIDRNADSHLVNDNMKDKIEKDDPVSRAQSLGDLSAGCTFSLVGQKKAGSMQALNETEFTGSQLAKHFRKYREMKPELIHGSLPGRMKCMGNETKVRPKLENINPEPENQLSVYNGGSGHCKKQTYYGSLQHLPMSEGNEHRHVAVRHREKTPIKPRRTLPQVPGDVDEKKKQYNDVMRLKIASRNSNSPSSRNSNRPHSSEGEAPVRQGGISATPSFTDKEVSALLEGSKKDYMWIPSTDPTKCNNVPHQKIDAIPPDAVYDKLSLSYPLYPSGTFHQHDSNTAQTGTRHCESGQNTITSQSTVDSGYITNDTEIENNATLSTSSYVKSLKESSNKLFKPSKGDNSLVTKGEKTHTQKHHRDSDTRNWIEKHPGTLLNEMKPKLQKTAKEESNAGLERHPKSGCRSASDNEHKVNSKATHSDSAQTPPKKLAHRVSDSSIKDMEKMRNERTYFKPKVKAVSMAYGLNLIDAANSGVQNNSGLSKTQTKFTGSLINLTSTENQGLKYAPSLDSLKNEVRTTNTLPGSWKFFGGNRSESSLKMLGKPSLFQLLQNYSVYPVRLKIPENFSLLDNIRLIECEVVLPSPWTMIKDVGTVTSPKGSYAKLGGPNSAFKPVVGGSSTVGSVSMVTIVDISNTMKDLYELGQINKGDLIVEVNERLVIGDDFLTLTKLLQTCQGELLLTIARDKARERQKLTVPKEDDLRLMEAKIASLTKEMRKKDRTLKQLNALLPWKQSGEGGKEADQNSNDICNLSEDEFIV